MHVCCTIIDCTMYVHSTVYGVCQYNTRSSGPVPVLGSERTGRPGPALNSSRVATLNIILFVSVVVHMVARQGTVYGAKWRYGQNTVYGPT
jgi:hypothetical protein